MDGTRVYITICSSRTSLILARLLRKRLFSWSEVRSFQLKHQRFRGVHGYTFISTFNSLTCIYAHTYGTSGICSVKLGIFCGRHDALWTKQLKNRLLSAAWWYGKTGALLVAWVRNLPFGNFFFFFLERFVKLCSCPDRPVCYVSLKAKLEDKLAQVSFGLK